MVADFATSDVLVVSVAVKVCDPAVSKVTGKVATLLVKVMLLGSVALGSAGQLNAVVKAPDRVALRSDGRQFHLHRGAGMGAAGR